MDPAAVRSLLATSLDPDADSRRRAELQLKQVRPAFVFASLVEVVEGTPLCLGIGRESASHQLCSLMRWLAGWLLFPLLWVSFSDASLCSCVPCASLQFHKELRC
jgi:hypothetical protein